MLKRHEAVKAITDCSREAYIIACNGLISRELYDADDNPKNFYVLGSMGLPSAIGLGLSLARPDKKILVLAGDGNQLMSLGTLATIGKASPKNFTEVILDNECYETTGGQETASSTTEFSEIATSSGFNHAMHVASEERLRKAIHKFLKLEGPNLIHAGMEKDEARPSRPEINPYETKIRFMKALAK